MAGIDTESYEYCTKFKNRGWNSSWKYVSEWVDLEPLSDSTNYAGAEYLYKAAKEAGRNRVRTGLCLNIVINVLKSTGTYTIMMKIGVCIVIE